jgi:hypothetical protein
MINASVEFETNPSVSVCATCLLAVFVQVWSTKTINEHGEGQVETGRADGLGAMKDEYETWTEGPRWLEDWCLTLRDINK